ncbi:MAG: DUF4340 domain-containing protein [Firmicutes bacterium]|nr:DUF4340 domain-containing protein [Bacillota bacterium]
MNTFTYPDSHKQKKNKPGGKKAIRALLLVLAILIAAILLLYPKKTKDSDGLFSLAALEEQIMEISWQYQGQDYDLTYENGEWHCSQLPEGYSLDQDKAATLAKAAAHVQAPDILSGDTRDLAAYGLDQPALRFGAADQTGNCYICYLGQIPGEDRYACYIADGDGIYLASGELAQTWQITPLSLLSAIPLSSVDPATVSRFSLRQNHAAMDFVYYPHGLPDEVYTVALLWFSGEEAGSRQPLDAVKTEEYLNFLTSLQADCVCPAANSTPEKLAAYGLNQPWATVSFTCQEITGQQGQETTVESQRQISIGNPTPDGGYYALGTDGDIGILTQETVQKITGVQPGDFAPDDVCLIELVGLNRLILNYQGQSYTFERTEQIGSHASVNDPSVLVVSYSKNGQAIDGEAFESCFERLTALRSNVYAEKRGGDTVATLRFERNASRNFPQMTLSVLTYDDRYYVVDFNGQQRLLVERDTFDSLLADFAAL